MKSSRKGIETQAEMWYYIRYQLVLEYEAAAKGILHEIPLTASDIDGIIDYLCAVANRRNVYYLWRPFSRKLENYDEHD